MGASDSPVPPDDREPRLRPALRERDFGELRVHLDLAWPDGFDLPAIGEGVVQLLPRYPPWPLRPRLRVAEAQQEQPAARLEHLRQSPDVAPPVVIREDVEEAAVDHAGEALAPAAERRRVLDQEPHR